MLRKLNFLDKICDKNIIVLEENAKIGGFGSLIVNYYVDKKLTPSISVIGAPDKFINHASVSEQLSYNGFTAENIISKLI